MTEKIGEIIRNEREKKKMTQEFVAWEMEMSQAAYSKIERGLTEIKASHLYNIAAVLGVTIYDLLPPALEANAVNSGDHLLKPVFVGLKSIIKSWITSLRK